MTIDEKYLKRGGEIDLCLCYDSKNHRCNPAGSGDARISLRYVKETDKYEIYEHIYATGAKDVWYRGDLDYISGQYDTLLKNWALTLKYAEA